LNPVEALIFFRLLLSNCLNWKIYCDDHSSLTSTTAVHIWIISYKLHIKSLLCWVLICRCQDLCCFFHFCFTESTKKRKRKHFAHLSSRFQHGCSGTQGHHTCTLLLSSRKHNILIANSATNSEPTDKSVLLLNGRK